MQDTKPGPVARAYRMKILIKYVGSNLLFVGALFASIYWEIRWLQVLVMIFVWVMLVFYAASFANRKSRRRFAAQCDPFPRVLTAATDAIVLIMMLTAGWYLTAAAYVTSAAILVAMFPRYRFFRWNMEGRASDN